MSDAVFAEYLHIWTYENVFENISSFKNIFFFEESVKDGSVSEKFGSRLLEKRYRGNYFATAVEDGFVKHASVEAQIRKYGLDADSMAEKVSENIG